jgi:Tol biopolymer transport system component
VVFQRCILPATQPCAVFRIQVDGTGLTALTHYSANTDELDLTPEFSPDGKTVAFFGAFRDGLISAIDLMDADGSNIRSITRPALEAFIPDWSPDGTKIAFSTRAFYPPNTVNPQLWVINGDGTGLKQLTFPGASAADTFVSWSPQGNAIVFERDNAAGAAIYILNVSEAGASEKLIFQGPARPKLTPIRQPAEAAGKSTRKPHFRLIESGGSNPKWGPAPQ